MIQAILFDFDGTLSKRYESAYRMYRRMIHGMLPTLDEDSMDFEAIVQRCMYWDEYGTVHKSYVVDNIEKNYAPDIDTDEWVKYWYAHFHECQIHMPGSLEALEKLQKRYRLGLVTNGNGESQMSKVKALNLEHFFEFSIASGDFGKHKPDPEIFLYAADQMRLKPDQIAFVGDTFATDILGAYKAGMLPVWFSYEKRTVSDMDVIQVTNFKEVEQFFLENDR